jgi:CHASE1-domain containing sensor protein
VRSQPKIRLAAAVIAGIGLLSVVTATITAAFVESARTRMGRGRDEEILKRLERIEQRLDGSDRTRQP